MNIPKKITAEFLAEMGARKSDVNKFAKAFPRGAFWSAILWAKGQINLHWLCSVVLKPGDERRTHWDADGVAGRRWHEAYIKACRKGPISETRKKRLHGRYKADVAESLRDILSARKVVTR